MSKTGENAGRTRAGSKRRLIGRVIVTALVLTIVGAAILTACGFPARVKVWWLIEEYRDGKSDSTSGTIRSFLNGHDPREEEAIVEDLAALGPDAIPALARACRDADLDVKTLAMTALAEIAVRDSAGVETVADLIVSPASGGQGRLFLFIFLDAGPPPKLATPVLIRALSDGSPAVQGDAAGACRKPTIVPADVVPALINALTDEDASVRAHAATALGYLREDAKAAAPAVSKLLDDPNAFVRGACVKALHKIPGRPDVATPALVRAVRDKAVDVRMFAACGLGIGDVDAKSAVPALAKALSDEGSTVRGQAVTALVRISLREGRVLPALDAATKSEHDDVRENALRLLPIVRDGIEDAKKEGKE
jgi:HEAT repeat protein